MWLVFLFRRVFRARVKTRTLEQNICVHIYKFSGIQRYVNFTFNRFISRCVGVKRLLGFKNFRQAGNFCKIRAMTCILTVQNFVKSVQFAVHSKNKLESITLKSGHVIVVFPGMDIQFCAFQESPIWTILEYCVQIFLFVRRF